MPLSYKDKWAELGPIYMSEESDDPGDPEVVIVKKLTWRSAGKQLILHSTIITLVCVDILMMSLYSTPDVLLFSF